MSFGVVTTRAPFLQFLIWQPRRLKALTSLLLLNSHSRTIGMNCRNILLFQFFIIKMLTLWLSFYIKKILVWYNIKIIWKLTTYLFIVAMVGRFTSSHWRPSACLPMRMWGSCGHYCPCMNTHGQAHAHDACIAHLSAHPAYRQENRFCQRIVSSTWQKRWCGWRASILEAIRTNK